MSRLVIIGINHLHDAIFYSGKPSDGNVTPEILEVFLLYRVENNVLNVNIACC